VTRGGIVAERVMRVRDQLLDEFAVITSASVVGFLLKEKLGMVDQLHKRVILGLCILAKERLATVNYCLETI
jgi:hypothetical protein